MPRSWDAGQAGAWIDDSGQLAIDAYLFRSDWLRRLPWPPKVPPDTSPKAQPSLFNPDVRLRIVRRGAQSIAMHWDKRDNNFMPFAGLPKNRVTLKFRRGPELKDGSRHVGRSMVTLSAGNTWMKQTPNVQLRVLQMGSNAAYLAARHIGFCDVAGTIQFRQRLARARRGA